MPSLGISDFSDAEIYCLYGVVFFEVDHLTLRPLSPRTAGSAPVQLSEPGLLDPEIPGVKDPPMEMCLTFLFPFL